MKDNQIFLSSKHRLSGEAHDFKVEFSDGTINFPKSSDVYLQIQNISFTNNWYNIDAGRDTIKWWLLNLNTDELEEYSIKIPRGNFNIRNFYLTLKELTNVLYQPGQQVYPTIVYNEILNNMTFDFNMDTEKVLYKIEFDEGLSKLFNVKELSDDFKLKTGIINLHRFQNLYLKITNLPVIKSNYDNFKGSKFIESSNIACKIPITTGPYDMTIYNPNHDSDGLLHLATSKYEGQIGIKIVDENDQLIDVGSEIDLTLRIYEEPRDNRTNSLMRKIDEILEYLKLIFVKKR